MKSPFYNIVPADHTLLTHTLHYSNPMIDKLPEYYTVTPKDDVKPPFQGQGDVVSGASFPQDWAVSNLPWDE